MQKEDTPKIRSGSGVPQEMDKDNQLLLKIREGDHDAFRELFFRWADPLTKFLRALTGSIYDAEDLCQDTFSDIWNYRSKIRDENNARALIFHIAKTRTWKLIRRRRKQEDIVSSNDLNPFYSIASDDVLIEQEMKLIADLVISSLPARTRQVYDLHYTGNFDYTTIAQKLGITESTVRAHIHTARSRIKDAVFISLLLLIS